MTKRECCVLTHWPVGNWRTWERRSLSFSSGAYIRGRFHTDRLMEDVQTGPDSAVYIGFMLRNLAQALAEAVQVLVLRLSMQLQNRGWFLIRKHTTVSGWLPFFWTAGRFHVPAHTGNENICKYLVKSTVIFLHIFSKDLQSKNEMKIYVTCHWVWIGKKI